MSNVIFINIKFPFQVTISNLPLIYESGEIIERNKIYFNKFWFD